MLPQKRQKSLQILVAFSNGNKKGDKYREVKTEVQQLSLLWDGRGRGVQKVQTPIGCWFPWCEYVHNPPGRNVSPLVVYFHGVNMTTIHQDGCQSIGCLFPRYEYVHNPSGWNVSPSVVDSHGANVSTIHQVNVSLLKCQSAAWKLPA